MKWDITAWNTMRHLRSSTMPSLHKSTARIHFANRAFCSAEPSVQNSQSSYIVDSGSLAVFQSRLKIFLFHQTFTLTAHDCHCLPSPLKSLNTLVLYKWDYYYYCYWQKKLSDKRMKKRQLTVTTTVKKSHLYRQILTIIVTVGITNTVLTISHR